MTLWAGRSPVWPLHPLRYRLSHLGYYYDQETGLYHLWSRYYDPQTGRFINADEDYSTGQGIIGCNMFAYCGNNPISRADYDGKLWVEVVLCSVLVYHSFNLVHSLYNQSLSVKGYIYNQSTGVASKFWYGFFRSSYNGCGWIATYNATIMLGKRVAPHKIISEYELTGALAYGAIGTQPYAIPTFFRSRGYKVTITYDAGKFDAVAKKNKANIIWYWHSGGAHFVALNWNGSKFVGYNTYSNSSGPDNWGSSISGFLKKKGYTGSMLISIR